MDRPAQTRSQRRSETVELFKSRLSEVMKQSGLTRSAFARRIGTDRSTLSQLLRAENLRLPRAETVAAIAHSFQVSADWLLGLSRTGQIAVDMVDETLSIESGSDTSLDECLRRWHQQATGYKIRYVPTTLPDLLKNEEIIRYEYRNDEPREALVQIERAEQRLAYNRRPETDMEVCSSLQSVEEFARGEGIWRGLTSALRREQIEQMSTLVDELYPTFRWFLFDGRRRYSAPLTVFGPQRVALYLGDRFLVLSATAQIRALTEHFDGLIRAAVVQSANAGSFLRGLLPLVRD